jgi:2-dehydropantoate 2-reductase
MEAKFKIVVVGIGGVGGYYGAKLAAYYANSDKAEVIFIARGENEKAIREHGLTIITPQSQDTIFPGKVTSDPSQIGKADLVICCVKNYDLDTGIVLLKDCIDDKTIIIPLLNGVNASEKIRAVYSQAKVWEACVYIISHLVSPGVIKEGGTVNQLFFGSESASQKDLHKIYDILTDAGINVFLSTNIMHTIWEKFLFISPFATITSWMDIPIGEVLANKEHKALLEKLIDEITLLAKVMGLGFPEDIKKSLVTKMAAVPFDTLSSMHSDFRRAHKTELEALTGAVINYGKQYHVATPFYEQVYKELKQKSHN